MTTFVVTNTNASGAGSLTEALSFAATATGPDRITFDAALKGQTIVTAATLILAQDVTIDGDLDDDHIADITLSGGDHHRIMTVNTGTVVSLEGLVLAHGRDVGANSSISTIGTSGSSAIYSGGDLSVVDSVFSGNTAIGGNGAQDAGSTFKAYGVSAATLLAQSSGRLTMSNVVFDGNSATGGMGSSYNGTGRVGGGASTILTLSGGNLNEVEFHDNIARGGAGGAGTFGGMGGNAREVTSYSNTSGTATIGASEVRIGGQGGAGQFPGAMGSALATSNPSLAVSNVLYVTTDKDEGSTGVALTTALSLREAIALAQNGDTIKFAAGLAGSTLVLNNSLRVDKSLTIDGDIDRDNKADITISGDKNGDNIANTGDARLFTFNSGATTLKSLTLTNGFSPYGGAMGVGRYATVTLRDSTISNSTANHGGAAQISGKFYSVNSTFFGNAASLAGGSAGSAPSGGALYFDGSSAVGRFVNTTITGNYAASGGIIGAANGAKLYMDSSTVASNLNGGGVHLVTGSAATLSFTILAGNVGGNSSGTSTIMGGPNFTGTITGLLGPLADNGGTVQTMALIKPASPATSGLIDPVTGSNPSQDLFDADGDGNTTELLSVDARGTVRVVGSSLDYGALEYSPSRAPFGQNKTVTLSEDTSRNFAASDFGFSDPKDHNTFTAIKIAALPAQGSLTLNGAAVGQGATILVSQLAQLVWTPPANGNGNGLANLKFQVIDSGSTADGGANTAVSANTLTFNVTAVNDAPTGTSKVVSVLEDGAKIFTAADFGFADVDGHTLAAVVITALPAQGSLMLNNVGVSLNQSIALAQLNRVSWSAPANLNGAAGSFTFKVVDSSGSNNIDLVHRTIGFNLTPVNDAPSGTSTTLTLNEDTARAFSAADFGFSDVLDNNAFSAVVVASLPAIGSLTLNGVAVAAGQSVAAASLGGLVWTPPANVSGTGIASFSFQVQDNGGKATILDQDTDVVAKTVTFTVSSVNDAPSGTSGTISGLEDKARAFSVADFGFSDTADGNAMAGIVITALPKGSLKLNGVAVALNQTIALADLGKLVWTPPANLNGNGVAALGFKVVDSGGTANGGVDTDPSADVLSFNLAAVNDAPVITSNGGKPTAKLTIEENKTAVTTVKVGDVDSKSFAYSLSGKDAAQFAIDSHGVLRLRTAADFETLTDSGKNHVYDVTVKVTDSGKLFDTQALSIAVKDIKGRTIAGTAGNDVIDDKHGAIGKRPTLEADRIDGKAGNDTINGGLGKDVLAGGAGADHFVFSTKLGPGNVDTITDFKHDIDRIDLDNKMMAGLGRAGALNPELLHAAAGANHGIEKDDRLVYDTASGKLFYDANGNAAGGVTQIAVLTGHPVIDAGDFRII